MVENRGDREGEMEMSQERARKQRRGMRERENIFRVENKNVSQRENISRVENKNIF